MEIEHLFRIFIFINITQTKVLNKNCIISISVQKKNVVNKYVNLYYIKIKTENVNCLTF